MLVTLETNPIHYLILNAGQPQTWSIKGGEITSVIVERDIIEVCVKLDHALVRRLKNYSRATDTAIVELRGKDGHPLAEFEVPLLGQKNIERRLCLRQS